MSQPLHPVGKMAGFGYEVGRLRFILRDFYQDGMSTAANVAEHTYRVSLLAWLIAEAEGADLGNVLQMALIHDLPEVRTLDHGVIASQYVAEREVAAATDMLEKILPSGLAAWHQYEARETLEAQIVKDADRLDVVLECKELKCRGLDYPALWDEELLMYKSMFFTNTAKRLFDDIWATHPMDWTLELHRRKLEKLKLNLSHKLKVA